MTVKSAPETPTVITPPADQTVIAGQPVTFTAVVSGVARLQWQKNGVNIAGATFASLTIPTAITSDSGAAFTVVATGASSSVTTRRAILSVMPAPNAPIMLVNPARVRLTTGQQATFSVTAWSATPMTYQWQKGAFLGNMADIPGATSSAYTTPPGTLADHLTLFRCVVSSAAGSTVSASEMLFVTAAPVKPNDVTSPVTVAAQAGAPFQYTIQPSGGSIPLTFTADPLPDGLTLDPNTGVISGAPTSTGVFVIAVGSANSAGSFSRNLTITVTTDPPVLTWDAWRRANFGASANDPAIAGETADPDDDGVTNLDEFLAGSNPLSGTGFLARLAERRSPGIY